MSTFWIQAAKEAIPMLKLWLITLSFYIWILLDWVYTNRKDVLKFNCQCRTLNKKREAKLSYILSWAILVWFFIFFKTNHRVLAVWNTFKNTSILGSWVCQCDGITWSLLLSHGSDILIMIMSIPLRWNHPQNTGSWLLSHGSDCCINCAVKQLRFVLHG